MKKLTMRYMQLRLTEEEFFMIKKAALNANVSLEKFLKAAVFEKMFSDSTATIEGVSLYKAYLNKRRSKMSNKKAVETLTKAETPKPAKRKRLAKVIDGTVLSITEAITDTTLTFDFSILPESIQSLLGPFGMSHKIGDAAAGKNGEEAVNAINKVWEGLLAGNWSVRAPAAEKISKKSILGKYSAMPEGAEKEFAGKLLKELGLMI